MDVADLIIREQRIRFEAVPAGRAVLAGEGLTHWSCTFRSGDDRFVVPTSVEGDEAPGAAFVLGLLAADMRDVGEGDDPEALARAWGIPVAEAAERIASHARLLAEAQAVLGETALLSLASGTPNAASAADEVLLSI